MKSRHILLQIKNLAVQPEGGGIAEQREATDHKILEGQRGVAEEPLREAVQSGHQRIIEREKTDPHSRRRRRASASQSATPLATAAVPK